MRNVVNNRMKRQHHILFIGLLFCFNQLFSQTDSNNGRIYSDFINQSVFSHDTIFKKNSNLIIVSFIKKKELGSSMDIEYLRDYLSRNIGNNETYKILNEKFNSSPISYFYQIPWGDFGKLLSRDSTFGYMILNLEKLLTQKYSVSKSSIISTNYKVKYSKGKIPKGSKEWDRFYAKNVNCFGIIKLSDITISGKYAVFYTESYHYSLFASGDLVFMEYSNNGWRILQYINLWMS